MNHIAAKNELKFRPPALPMLAVVAQLAAMLFISWLLVVVG